MGSRPYRLHYLFSSQYHFVKAKQVPHSLGHQLCPTINHHNPFSPLCRHVSDDTHSSCQDTETVKHSRKRQNALEVEENNRNLIPRPASLCLISDARVILARILRTVGPYIIMHT